MRKVTEQGFRSVSLKLYANLRIYALKSFFFILATLQDLSSLTRGFDLVHSSERAES